MAGFLCFRIQSFHVRSFSQNISMLHAHLNERLVVTCMASSTDCLEAFLNAENMLQNNPRKLQTK